MSPMRKPFFPFNSQGYYRHSRFHLFLCTTYWRLSWLSPLPPSFVGGCDTLTLAPLFICRALSSSSLQIFTVGSEHIQLLALSTMQGPFGSVFKLRPPCLNILLILLLPRTHLTPSSGKHPLCTSYCIDLYRHIKCPTVT